MFTGIIKEIGKINTIKDISNGRELEVICSRILKGIENGDSICVNGCCLTVKKANGGSFFCDISFSTLSSTSFKNIKTGDFVNLEDSLRPSGKLGGHFVTGHVDCVTDITGIEDFGEFYRLRFRTPETLLPYIAQKGSIAVEGISLTVEQAGDDHFSAVIIPHTMENTNLKFKNRGDLVNLEIDLIARYIGQIIKNLDFIEIRNAGRDKILKEKLIKYGFYK